MGIKEPHIRERKLLLDQFFQSAEDNNDSFPTYYTLRPDADEKINPIRRAFMKCLPSRLTWSKEERRQREGEYNDGKLPRSVSKFVDHSVRFFVALTGGLVLGVPMLVMSKQPSAVKNLAAGSSFILFLAFVLAFWVRVSNVETLVSTFAYAAVLIGIMTMTTGCDV
ncbi:hypothetical protein F5Y05DRAFT_424130 [Hypoxylon sp. FL0543]|nr:hypothetical protein F5Y05DRAFT_424130 [Hypoxylon sp. FL0543]